MSVVNKDGNLFNTKADAIAHQTNCFGAMGAGFAQQLRKRYPEVYNTYRNFCYKYGAKGVWNSTYCLTCDTNNGIKVINIFAQFGYGRDGRKTDYTRLEKAFKEIERDYRGKTVAIPYGIGCGLAGGDWNGVVQPMIHSIFDDSETCLEIWKYNQ